MKKLALLLLLPLFVFTSCNKDDSNENDPKAPQLTINEPKSGVSVSSGQTIYVDASIQIDESRTLREVIAEAIVFGVVVEKQTYTEADFGTGQNGLYSVQENFEVPDTQGRSGTFTLRITIYDSAGASDIEELEVTVN